MGADIAGKRVVHGVAHHKVDAGAGRDLPLRALLLFRMGAVGGTVGPVTLGLAGGRRELRLMQQRHPPRKHSLDPADPGGLVAEVRPLNARRGLYGGADCLIVESPRKGEGVVLCRLPAQALLPTLKTDQHAGKNPTDTDCHGGFPPVLAYGKGDRQHKAEQGRQKQQPLRQSEALGRPDIPAEFFRAGRHLPPRSSMIWSRSSAAYSNSSILLAAFISFSRRAMVSARSRSLSFFLES